MRIRIIDEYNYEIDENGIYVNKSDLDLIGKGKKFDIEHRTIINEDDYIDKNIYISDLKSKLQSTDYQAIKYAEGLISEEEYAQIKAQRQAWRDEINQLEEELNSTINSEIQEESITDNLEA